MEVVRIDMEVVNIIHASVALGGWPCPLLEAPLYMSLKSMLCSAVTESMTNEAKHLHNACEESAKLDMFHRSFAAVAKSGDLPYKVKETCPQQTSFLDPTKVGC